MTDCRPPRGRKVAYCGGLLDGENMRCIRPIHHYGRSLLPFLNL